MTPREVIPAHIPEEVEDEVSIALNRMVDKMRIKPVSKRQWKARLKLGRWIPRMVVERWSLTAPEGMKLVWHPEEDFLKIQPKIFMAYRDYHPIKKAWE